MFLTHKECEEHLKEYGYNYSEDAHAYAMTAQRSPEVETLLNILESVESQFQVLCKPSLWCRIEIH